MARPIDLASHIQKLLEEKEHRSQELSRIDQTLEQISGLLAQNGVRRGRKPGRPAVIEDVASGAAPKGRRKRRKFAISGNDLILNFVRQRRNPVTREIAELWKSEGRAGRADNTLSQLVKARKLKRTPLGGGERGSKYSLA